MPNPLISEFVADLREQVLYLRELGIDRLSLDLPVDPASFSLTGSSGLTADGHPEAIEPAVVPEIPRPVTQQKRPVSRISALPSLTKRPPKRPIADLMTPVQRSEFHDIDTTQSVLTPQNEQMNETATLYGEITPALEVSSDSIESIRAEIGDCTRCPLHAHGRTQIVHTTGNFNADLMFIGEAPGADEDEQGFPFVGRAGQLLTKIIESIGMKREEVCIGNINRCRPPENRKPEPEETAACRPFILREIAVIKPKVIVVLGATAAHNLLQVKTPISKLRGNFHEYFGVKVMPTFHPAYLLRDPHKKREVWDDMKKVRDLLVSGVN
jgi:uracil-DNA glycosylase